MLLSMGLRVHAQQTRIRVVDDSDGQPVPFCHICLEDKKSGKQEYIVGDVNGTAEVTLGEDVILSVSSMGYEHFLSRDVTSSETLEVRLTPSNFGLDEVVVTGQYKPVRADKSIYNIKLIGKPRIENQAANTMAELLSKELTFKINNDPSTGSSLNLQGMSGENVKILVDGVPVIGRLDGNIDLSQLNLDNVDHIEIVEGPMSVIYGSNALAGVVNIITKQSSSARFKTGVRSYYESVGVYNVNGDAELNGDNHSLAFSGGRNFFGGYSLVDTSRSKEWKPKEQYNAGIGYLYRKDRFSVRYKTDFFREKLLDRNAAYSWPYYENGNDIWFTTLRFNNSLHLDKQLPGDNSFNLLLAHSYYWRSKQDYKIDLTTLESNLVPNPDAHDTTLFHAVVACGGFSHAREEGTLDYQFGFDVNTEYGQGKRFAHGEENIGDYALFAGLQYRP
ncbi:MAG: TonB-dependent receptor plug domain-containing protein [Bacteroidales bacterium]